MFKYWVDILYLQLRSLYYCIFCALFLRNPALQERGTNPQSRSQVALQGQSSGLLVLTLLLSSLLSFRYIKSIEGLVEASRRLKMSGTAVHGGTLPAGRPSTAIFLGTACQSIPQCPTTPLETNGLKQQQLQTAWILSFLVFLFLFLEKIICIPPKHPTHLGDLSGSCILIPAEYPCSEPFPPPLHGHGRKLFVCLESPVFASLQTENKPFTALA